MNEALVVIGITVGLSIIAIGICDWFDGRDWKRYQEYIRRQHESKKSEVKK
jgi:hypothetical protein